MKILHGSETVQVDSGHAGRLVGEWFMPGFREWNEARQERFIEAVDFPVRKTAHATEYAILGMLVLGTIYEGKRRPVYNYGISWLIATGYAATDEFHQLFVPGRSGQIRDVLIDSGGVLTGLIFICLVNWLRMHKARKDA